MPTFTVSPAEAGKRLDAIIAEHFGISVNEARRLIQEGVVRVDGKRSQKGSRLALDQRIEVKTQISPIREDGRTVARSYAAVPEPFPLSVLHEDELLVAIDKPAGRHCHPLVRGELGTMANALVAAFPDCGTASDDPREGGLVHRLDRDTSGVLIAARTREAYVALRSAFSEGDVDKIYWALVHGVPEDKGLPGIVIDAPLVSRGATARVARDDPEALPSRTEVRVLVAGESFALVEARARTGRMHQVRAHLAHLGHPLVGDTRYGAPPCEGVLPYHALLHARSVTLPHPRDGWRLACAAPLSVERRALFERLLRRPVPTDR